MIYDKILVYEYLKNNKLAFVKVNPQFKQELKSLIIKDYSTINNFNRNFLKICPQTLHLEFRKNKYFKFDRLIKITDNLNIQTELVYNEISAFFAKGSNTSKELILDKEIVIDEFFVEGFALYFAEGDNGSNGNSIPRKLRFTNSDIILHNHFMKWLYQYFPDNFYYFLILVPYEKELTENHLEEIKYTLQLEDNQIRIKKCKWKRKTDFVYRTCLDSALLIDLILAIQPTIKELCKKDKNLARAYIRGMMIGEGTAYFNRSRYVRIEMRNKEEIHYLHELFTMLGFNCKPSLRSERHNMWSLFIGAKQLKKYNDEIGFGVHKKRQEILEKGVNKKLRVNQFC